MRAAVSTGVADSDDAMFEWGRMCVARDVIVKCEPHAGIEVELPAAEHGLLQTDPENEVSERVSELLPAHEIDRGRRLFGRPEPAPENVDGF